jgi:lipopolysaccharide transport system ATP-binding protein
MATVISVENLSKTYRLGQIGTGTLSRDLSLWWAQLRGKPSFMSKTAQIDHGNRDGSELWALRDVSFSVEQGEVLGIIGRNGAGKSTLLKILSRVTAPTSGRIKVKGRVASLLEVGTGFHPDLTGRENIYLNGAILGMTRREIGRKFDEIVDFAEVGKFIDTPVKRYSSGMYVRLAFAIAAHLEPEILVVDEVLAVGDSAFQKKCLGKMGNAAHEGRTIFFVSHNMAAVRVLCHRGMLLDRGKIVCAGDISKAIYEYTQGGSANNQASESHLSDIKFSHPRIVNIAGSVVNSIEPGDDFSVLADLIINKHIDSFDFYFIIRNSEDDLILVLRANPKEFSDIRKPGSYELCLNIPALWLMPGQYNCQFKLIEYSIGAGQIRHLSNDFILNTSSADDIPDILMGKLAPAVEWSISRR